MWTCLLSFPYPKSWLTLWWKQMKSIIVLPIESTNVTVKHWAQIFQQNKAKRSRKAFLCWVAKRTTGKTRIPGQWTEDRKCVCDTQTWRNISICVAGTLAVLVFLRTESSRKDEGFPNASPCLRYGDILTQPCKCNYTGPMARGPTLKPPPWERDSVLVWQPLTAAESQSGHLRHLKVKCFHGKFVDPSSSLGLV